MKNIKFRTKVTENGKQFKLTNIETGGTYVFYKRINDNLTEDETVSSMLEEMKKSVHTRKWLGL